MVMVAPPETNVHKPVPITGVFPASTVAVAQIVWFGPAFETVGFASRWIDIVEDELGQTPLLMVHCNILLVAIDTAVTPDVSNVGVVIVAPPETKVHKPVPITGVFPASTVAVAQIVWFGPATDGVGLSSRWIDIVEDELGQTPLLMVHCNILLVAIDTAVTPDVSNVGVVIVAPPETNVHKPVPITGVFPASTVVVAQIV